MSLTLDLEPEVERSLRDTAAAEGISINELLARTFPPRTTPSDPRAHVQALIARWQQQDGTPVAPSPPNDGTLTASKALFWSMQRRNDPSDLTGTEASNTINYKTGTSSSTYP